MIAIRSINFTGGGADPEEAMYKELLIGLAENTLTGTVTVPEGVTTFGRDFLFTSQPGMTELIIDGVESMNRRPYYNCTNLKTVRFNRLKTLAGQMFNAGNSITDMYLPALEDFSSTVAFYPVVSGTMRTIHITTKTCDQIMAMNRFPGLDPQYGYTYLRFEGSDGMLTWDGSAWVKS